MVLLSILTLAVPTSYALPNKETIQEVLYEHDQACMKTDILYKLRRKEYIKKKGMEAWREFILDAGMEEIMLKEKKNGVNK